MNIEVEWICAHCKGNPKYCMCKEFEELKQLKRNMLYPIYFYNPKSDN